MNSRDAQRPRRRAGFTLIELLVVIFLIGFLAALTVAIGPGLLISDSASRGAQLLQGNLFIAKLQALRDVNPYGIRLLPDADGQVRSIQFIQQPSDFTGGTVVAPPGQLATFTGVDLSGGLPLTQQFLWPVLPGDYLQVQGGNPHLIKTVNGPTGVPPNSVVVQSPFVTGSPVPTADYRIFRGPRPVAGEDTIYLPDKVVVDMIPPTKGGLTQIMPDLRPNPNNPTQPIVNYDILFTAGGPVQGPAAVSGKIILWVREDPADPPVNYGWASTSPASAPTSTAQQSFIVIFTRTGLIASYPVDTSSGNPYSYVQNPRAAGGL